ncbi:MAG TPA: hypothetical protein VKZ41_07415 [Gemmatimonadales bacterium]|nr:hypothetical protein [Gemmatimonadales bacterium]
MYSFMLTTHNLLRWLILIVGAYALIRAISGVAGKRRFEAADGNAGKLFTISLDIQLLVGLLLYGIFSPVTRQAFADMGAAMAVREIRFFVAEHFLLMLLAVAAAHITSVLVRRAPTDDVKFKRMGAGVAITLGLILGGMPWWRPMFPGM